MKNTASNRLRSIGAALALAIATSPSGASAQSHRRTRAARATTAAPQSPSPVTLTVTPDASSLHWSFDIQNNSGAPVDVVADRRLLRIEIQPSGTLTALPTRGRRAARAPRVAICQAPFRPSTNQEAQRVHLNVGEHYTEGFDLRDLCGLRLPAGLVPGATLAVHYGFGSARGFAHAITFDNQDPPVVDIASAPVVVLGDTNAWPPAAGDARRGDDRLRVTVAGQPDGSTLTDLTASVRVSLAGHYPLWVFDRPGQVRFEITNPRGEAISCRRGVRDYNAVRDFFTRLGGGRSINETLVLANLCTPEGFAIPGIYRAQAVFETHASGERFGLQSFLGSAGSTYFFMRVRRGAQPGPYQRLPVDDPFAPRSSARDEGSRRP